MGRHSHGSFRGIHLFLWTWAGCVGDDQAPGNPVEESGIDILPIRDGCGTADLLVYPVPQADYRPGSYAGRRFGNPDDHLGEDISLPEETAVRSVGNGTVKVYRAADGYGELVAVIEHDLGRYLSFRNGEGDLVSTRYILSIYGHLRRSEARGGAELGLRTGDCVRAGDVVGYVNDDLHNGDGDVHLHAGVRLMSAAEAIRRDEAWFRGYDQDGRWRADFAAMSEVISGMLNSVTRHPDGALIKEDGDPDIFLLEDGRKRLVEDETVWRDERFWTAGNPDGEWHRAAVVSDEELDCYPDGAAMDRGVRRRLIRCGDGDFLYREDNRNRQRIPVRAGSGEYRELVRSWGFDEGEIERGGDGCDGPESFDALYLRDGTLVREEDRPDVYFVTSHGAARPIASWDLFLAMGYQANDIQWLPRDTLRNVVREIQRDQLIGWDYARDCLIEAGDEGGGGECAPTPEICNGLDDDCDGAADEDFDLEWEVGNCGRCGISCLRPHAQVACVRGSCAFDGCDPGWHNADGDWANGCEYECSPAAEICNGLDDDCDGVPDDGIDCAAEDSEPAPEAVDTLRAVRILFCPGEDGALNADLPRGEWDSHRIEGGCVDLTFRDVPDGTYRMNGEYLDGAAWECNEWPRGRIWLRNDAVPRAWIDGAEVEVTYGHDPEIAGGIGCNFFLEVS